MLSNCFLKEEIIAKKLKGVILILCFWFGVFSFGWAQEVLIKGKITDAQTGEELPYVFISVFRTTYGTETDDNGYYTFKALVKPGDSLFVNYIGYRKTKLPIDITKREQVINFALLPADNEMQEIVVTVYENPAFGIMRKVIKYKEENNPLKLTAYRYDSYSKIELGVDDLGERMQRKKFMKAISRELAKDSMKLEKGANGSTVLPIIFSETISKVYRNKEGIKSKEEVLALNTNNIGFASGRIVKPLLYSTYQDCNFYMNRVRILQADFLSPIADSWQLMYEYELVDTVWIDGDSCYQINVTPKNPRDLAFTGTIWIADSTYALKQIDVTTNQKTKLNFVESIKIFQLNTVTSARAWMPAKTRIELNLSGITHWKLGVLARLTLYARNMVVNEPMPANFFDEGVVEMEDANDRAREMPSLRADTLTQYEKDYNQSINSIRKVKPIRRYIALANILSTGFYKVKWIEFGHYFALYNRNDIEGVRNSLGFRTNASFSRKIILKGYGAYGYTDKIFKHAIGVDFIADRRPWTIIGYEYRFDLDQLGLNPELAGNNEIFYAFSKNGTLRGPYYNNTQNLYFQRDLARGLTQRISLRYRDFDAAFPFAYYTDATMPGSPISKSFYNSEIIFDTHWGKDEFRFINGNQRISIGAKRWPIFNLRNAIGVKNILGSDFNYYKTSILMTHNFAVGILGRVYYDIYVGKIFGTVPYPLLETHIGNESMFYSNLAFNQMNNFEFISDAFATLRLRHYFGGLFFNRIPLIKKFKWGFFVTTNIAYGSLSSKNYNLIPSSDVNGNDLKTFYRLNNKPYIEVGYGIENIFKFLRVDFVHRLTYLNNTDVRPFGIKLSFQVGL